MPICILFIFVEEKQLSLTAHGESGNACGNQSDLLHEEGSHHTGHGDIHETTQNSREGNAATDTQEY
jgi:hypothetical protein